MEKLKGDKIWGGLEKYPTRKWYARGEKATGSKTECFGDILFKIKMLRIFRSGTLSSVRGLEGKTRGKSRCPLADTRKE